MAPPKRPARRVFQMPPAAEAPETKVAEDVYTILRGLTAHTAATRAEVRLLRNELHKFSEDIMKLSQLSSSVDRLISVATSLKQQADRPREPSEQPDDPAVEELHNKIQRAIAVLEGKDDQGFPAGGASGEAGTQPSAEALATDINHVDPNAR